MLISENPFDIVAFHRMFQQIKIAAKKKYIIKLVKREKIINVQRTTVIKKWQTSNVDSSISLSV